MREVERVREIEIEGVTNKGKRVAENGRGMKGIEASGIK